MFSPFCPWSSPITSVIVVERLLRQAFKLGYFRYTLPNQQEVPRQ
jgi:hypothetical protein